MTMLWEGVSKGKRKEGTGGVGVCGACGHKRLG